MVTKADLEKLKIDIVNGLHKVGRKYACASLAEIEKTAVETSSKFKKTKSHSNVVKREDPFFGQDSANLGERY